MKKMTWICKSKHKIDFLVFWILCEQKKSNCMYVYSAIFFTKLNETLLIPWYTWYILLPNRSKRFSSFWLLDSLFIWRETKFLSIYTIIFSLCSLCVLINPKKTRCKWKLWKTFLNELCLSPPFSLLVMTLATSFSFIIRI